MQQPLPNLADFGISERTGFLSDQPPLHRLPATLEPLERVLDDLSHLLVTGKLRSRIHRLPVLPVHELLTTEQEYQRAFLVFSLLSHAYIWGAKGDPVLHQLPRPLSQPWIHVAVRLGLRPISCHAALVYWNWRLLDSEDPVDLSNLATLHTVSGGIDESWFYLVTMAIESTGAPALRAMLRVHEGMRLGLPAGEALMVDNLAVIREAIQRMTSTLMRMNEHCDPHIFYHRVRIYFSGWANMKDLPNGLVYEGDQGEVEDMLEREHALSAFDSQQQLNLKGGKATAKTPEARLGAVGKRYAGGSAAQSALIHSLDIFLGVEHQPTGEGPHAVLGRHKSAAASQEHRVNFLKEMRYHLPRNYRAFLSALEGLPSLRQYVQSLDSRDPVAERVINAFNECVHQMKVFRDKHIQIVTLYIIIQSTKARKEIQQAVGYHGLGSNVMLVDESPPSPAHSIPMMPIQSTAPSRDTSQPVSPMSDGEEAEEEEDRGTGGTDVIPFLKQSRNETAATAVIH